MFLQDNTERILLGLFLFLSYFYCAPPLRFKEKPFRDFTSNYLYIIPGIFAYYLAAGSLPPEIYMVGAFFHISAMHIYSAIPDLKYDRQAGIRTTPVYIGKNAALVSCLAFWTALSAIVVYMAGFYPLSFLVFLYPLFSPLLLVRRDLEIEKLYWYLPYVNTCRGGLFFCSLVIYKLFFV